jgi:hypothetical protein
LLTPQMCDINKMRGPVLRLSEGSRRIL